MMDKSNITRRRVLQSIGVSSVLVGAPVASAAATGNEGGASEEDQESDGEAIESALLAMAEYMTLYSDNSLETDFEQAKKDKVSESTIQIGRDFEELHNLTIESVSEDSFLDQTEEKTKLQKRFEPYFTLVAEGDAERIIPATTEEGSALNPEGITTLDGGCGGTREDPHTCPPYNWTSNGPWDSKGDVQDYLSNNGFHETAGYASGYGGDGQDYTEVVDAYGCSGGPFRTHALIRQRDGDWSYKTQTPEPNPEIAGYIWPTVNWGTYVEWWHTNHC